jgi:hypothetical protein
MRTASEDSETSSLKEVQTVIGNQIPSRHPIPTPRAHAVIGVPIAIKQRMLSEGSLSIQQVRDRVERLKTESRLQRLERSTLGISELKTKPKNKAAVECLQNGGLLIYPTETTYGIGVDATNQVAVNKLLKYKRRREGKPLSIAVIDLKMAEKYVKVNKTAKNIYQKFLGNMKAMSLVLPLLFYQTNVENNSLYHCSIQSHESSPSHK